MAGNFWGHYNYSVKSRKKAPELIFCGFDIFVTATRAVGYSHRDPLVFVCVRKLVVINFRRWKFRDC